MRTLTLLLILSTTAAADQIVLDSEGAAPGVVYIRVEVAADGSLTAKHVPKVFSMDVKQQTVLKISPVAKDEPIVVAEENDPPPVVEDPPTPPEPDENFFPPKKTEVQQKVIELANAIGDDDNRRGTALVIAGVYDDIANLIEQGVLGSMQDVWRATNTQYGSTVRRYRKLDNWIKWKAETDDLLKPADLDEAMDLWREVAEALKDVQNVGD